MTIYDIKNDKIENLEEIQDLRIADSNASIEEIEAVLRLFEDSETLRYLDIAHLNISILPANIASLTKLRRIGIQCPNLSNLEGISFPKSLTDISISSEKLAKIEHYSFETCTILSNLSIYAPFENSLDLRTFFNLTALRISNALSKNPIFLDAQNSKISTLSLTNLSNCNTFDLSHFERLWTAEISNCGKDFKLIGLKSKQALRYFAISNLSEFPTYTDELTQVQLLTFKDCSFSEIPISFIEKVTHLTRLIIINTPIVSVPEDWSAQKKLDDLEIRGTLVKNLNFVSTIPKLSNFVFKSTVFDLYSFFETENKAVAISNISDYATFKFLGAKEVNSCISSIARSSLEKEAKIWIFEKLNTLDQLDIDESWPFHRRIQALNINHKLLRKKLESHLAKLSKKEGYLSAFAAGAKVFLDGNFTEKKTEIKQKLAQLNIEVKTSLDEAVSHVILGKNPKNALEFYGENSFPFILEQQLYPIIKKVGTEDQYLVQEAAQGESTMLDSLLELLGSTDPNNVSIGLEMIKTGGTTPEILETLLLVHKTTSEAAHRTSSKKILEIQGPAHWKGLLSDRTSFKDVENAKEKENRVKLEKMERLSGKIAVYEFAHILARYRKKGLAYILANFPTGSLERLFVLNLLTQGNHFDFCSGIGYANWKDKLGNGEGYNAPVKTGIAFPSDHPNPLSIKSIDFHNCKFNSLDKGLVVFERVESIDLSHNTLKTLNPVLSKLKKLRYLDLRENMITSFPAVLERLPNLERLDLRFNVQGAYRTDAVSDITIPDSFRAALPNCEVLL